MVDGIGKFKGRAHRERVQPKKMRRLGPLERHRDYKRRAALQNARKRKIQRLRRMAAARNPDEFHFGMQRTHVDTRTGQRRLDADAADERHRHTAEEMRLLETQDAAYLNMRRTVDLRRAEKIRATLHGTEAPISAIHTLFVDADDDDDDDAADARTVLAKRLDTAPELVFERVRPTTRQLREEKLVVGGDAAAAQRHAARRELLRREAEERQARAERIGSLVRELEIKRALAGPGHKFRRVDKRTGAVQYIWRQERKR